VNKADLLAKTKTELLKAAQRLGLRGVSTLNKEELADRIYEAQQRPKATARQPMGVSAVARKVADAVKRRAVRKRAAMLRLKKPQPPMLPPRSRQRRRAHAARKPQSQPNP